MKIAICQIRTELIQEETVAKAEAMVREAAENGADIVVLPEMWNCPYSKGYFKLQQCEELENAYNKAR